MSRRSRKPEPSSQISLAIPSLAGEESSVERTPRAPKRRDAAGSATPEQLEIWIGDVLVHRAPPSVARSLRYLMAGGLPTSFGVTSSIHGEGVTSISRTLAALIASDWGHSTCWVDLNWWSHRPAREVDLFAVTLSDVVQERASIDDLPSGTSVPGLSLVSAGEVEFSSRARIATSLSLLGAIGDLANRFDFLVMDLPPVLTTSDAVILTGLTAGYLLVVRQEAASSVQVQATLGALTSAPCLGTVLTGAQTKVPRSLRTSSEVWALGT